MTKIKKNKYTSKDVSVVICTRNAEHDIKKCLESVLKNNPGEILIVDGNSSDNTLSIVKQMDVRFISDNGKGLSYARKIGVERTKLPLIIFCGPDNILQSNFINNFILLKSKWKFDVASACTRILNPKNFWDKGMDFRWQCNVGKPGKTDVPGTPNIYDRLIFNKVQFSAKDFGVADDTYLCEQLKKYKYKLGIVPITIYEKNNWSMTTIWNRFKFYGTGDSCFYNECKSNWTFYRKILSISHPLRQTFNYSIIAARQFKICIILWLFFSMIARYYGWISYSRDSIKSYSNY